MKQLKPLLLLLIAIALALSSCKKSITKPPVPSDSFRLKVNGVAKTAIKILAQNVQPQVTIQILGGLGPTEYVSILILNAKVGNFDVADAGTVIATYAPDNIFDDQCPLSTGTVTITTLTSDAVAGTFIFSGLSRAGNTVEITEGKFSAKLTTP